MEYHILKLTEASCNYGNLNIRICGRNFFPPDIYGKSNRNSGLGKQITLQAEGLESIIKTDIPVDSKSKRPRWLFRERVWLKQFVHVHNLIPGDRVVIKRISNLTYMVSPEKKVCKKTKGFRKTQHPKVLSLFAGCGGLDLGFHDENYDLVWANDNNEWAVQSFENYFGKNKINCNDIMTLDPYKDASVPDCHIILDGFPCQDFSIIWRRPGLNGERGAFL